MQSIHDAITASTALIAAMKAVDHEQVRHLSAIRDRAIRAIDVEKFNNMDRAQQEEFQSLMQLINDMDREIGNLAGVLMPQSQQQDIKKNQKKINDSYKR